MTDDDNNSEADKNNVLLTQKLYRLISVCGTINTRKNLKS